ncbi:hypothetical protein ACXKXE_004863 [Escherichia coli]|jgi:hypothetical protein|nr:hypothetical protein [Clostridium perfringens]
MNNQYEMSGVYQCNKNGCTNEVIHVKGENFNSCGACQNNNWKFIRETKLGTLVDLSKMQLYLEWIKTMMFLDTIA